MAKALSRFSSALLKVSLAVSLVVGGAAVAHGQFLETLSWHDDWSYYSLGPPAGFDFDTYGDAFAWNGAYSGGNTNCLLTIISNTGYVEQSSPQTFTGVATPMGCKVSPDNHTYVTGTYAYNTAAPKTLFLARYGIPNQDWLINFYDGSQPAQVPIAIDADSSNNAHLAINITDTIHSHPYLSLLEVNSTSSVIYLYGTDYSIDPTSAAHKTNHWYVTGSNNNTMSEIGGASWSVYDGNGSRFAEGSKDSYYLNGTGDYVHFDYMIAPAPDYSFMVIENATYHYLTDPSKPNNTHTVRRYGPTGNLLQTTGPSDGLVMKVVNQGAGHPAYFYEYDGVTGNSPGVPTLYQFSDYNLVFNWKIKTLRDKAILPDATGLFVVGTDVDYLATDLYRFDTKGKMLWSTSYVGDKASAQNYPLAAFSMNDKLYVEGILSNKSGPVVDLRQYLPGPHLQSLTGPSTVKSGDTITLTITLNAPAQGTIVVGVNLGPHLTYSGSNSIALFLQKGSTGASLPVKAGKVSQTTNDVVSASESGIVRTHTVTISP